jgi:hypothetical protein
VVAAQLRISERTVRFHLSECKRRLGATTRAQAIDSYRVGRDPYVRQVCGSAKGLSQRHVGGEDKDLTRTRRRRGWVNHFSPGGSKA